MELVKKNIHMDRIRAKATDQITLDDDINVSDSMPDAQTIILDKAEVRIEEVKGTTDHVAVKGLLLFSVLYQTDEENSTLYCMNGKIPFDEQMYMEGAENTDTINVKWELEDFNSSLINSRKLNIQALIALTLTIEELYDEETAVELCMEEQTECCRKQLEIAQIAVNKKDIFRLKEEIQLPQNEPNIAQVLWQSIQPSNIRFEPMEEKIGIEGEVNLFLLYEGEGEDSPVRTFTTSLPVKGSIECHGCMEHMFSDIGCTASHQEIEIRPDFDGEERVIGLDMVLDLDIKLYEQETMEILSDVYGVTKEIEAVTRPAEYRRFLPVEDGECRISDHMKIRSGSAQMQQILHSEGCIHMDNIQWTDGGISIDGSIEIKALYRTMDEKMPYSSIHATFPFQYVLKTQRVSGRTDVFHVTGSLKQFMVNMTDYENLEIKAVLLFQASLFSQVQEEIIAEIRVSDLDAAIIAELPGMVAYVAREGDTLWQLGKKYYVPISQIMEMNNLASDQLEAGARLLIVK
ncbi:MAG: DUF3794 domain-containing protein [Clostridiales bacterium]|nr:DUF3794 domain-containing protein [Clostridiales bacterium]